MPLKTLRVALLAVLLVAGDAAAQAGEYFFVRLAKPAHWRVLKIHGSHAENVKRSIREHGGGGRLLVEWPAFTADPQRYLAPLVIKDEYPGAGMAKGLVAILDRYPMHEFGVTWTGGIAVVADDYAHAERLLQLFQSDPAAYERTKVPGKPGRDPLHPANQVGPVVANAWWKCGWWAGQQAPRRTAEQRRGLEAFGLDRFSPKPPDYEFSRSDLIGKFGQPRRVTSKKVLANPRDPGDRAQWIVTTWEYPGLTLTTAAREESPERLWMQGGEAFEAQVPLGRDVRVGQSIEEWARRLGRPECPQPGVRGGDKPNVFSYEWQASYFDGPGAYKMNVEIDYSGAVTRVTWEHGSMH